MTVMDEGLKEHIEKVFDGGFAGDVVGYPVAFDAAYKYNGQWNRAFAIGYKYKDINRMNIHCLFCSLSGKVRKRKTVDKVFIFSVHRPININDDFEFDQVMEMGMDIVSITKNLMLQGRIEKLMFVGPNHTYLEHLWIRGKLFLYEASELSVQYLKVPIGTKKILTTNRTTIVNLNELFNKGSIVEFRRPLLKDEQ